MDVDLVQLAERSAAVTGDFLVASATVAATQASSAVGSAVAQLVMGRLGISPATSEAVPALQAAPGDEQRRSDLAATLRDVLSQDPGFVQQLKEALGTVDRTVHAVASEGGQVWVDPNFTANDHGVVVGGDQHNTKRITKRSGALWTVAAVLILGGGTTLLVTQNSSETTLQQKAEKTAVDFIRAGYSGDIETMCGLTSPSQDGNIAPCLTKESVREAKAEAKASTVPDDQRAFAQGWEAESSNLPSDNTAIVTTVNKNPKASVVIHLTRESGEWRVTSTEGGVQRTP
ncbi:hypothetical protein ACFW95_43245 [Streptomyces sp. NPDC059474]|uniref:hypothetical protein n=1 Tax=unclassified Streptomyces TaxID=2593676 RepID=UPI0033CD1C60